MEGAGMELEGGVDDDLTNDVASLRAILNEAAPSTSQEGRRECNAVTELQVCLDKNVALQGLLREKLREIEVALQDNEQKMEELQKLSAARGASKKGILTVWRLKRGDYFKDHKGQTPPSLSAGPTTNDHLGAAVYSTELSWTSKTMNHKNDRLVEGVKRQIIDSLTQPLQRSLSRTNDSDQKTTLRREIQEISRRSIEELLREDFTIDWNVLAYEQFNFTRTAIDCELHWKGHAHPFLNKGAWTKEEDKCLLRVVQDHGNTNWRAIAAEMGTNRTGFMCLQRFQQSLNPSKFTKVFTLEEDDRLTEAVSIYGDSKWKMVSAYVGCKTPPQCMHRWNNSIRPDIKKGRWRKEEDEVLHSAVMRCGVGNWTKVASLVPGRTQSQVRERWVNHHDQRISKTEWTKEEDEKLKTICQRYSGSIPWSTVAREMVTRTDNMCYIRWQTISDATTIVRHFTETLIHKESVMTNFCGRKGCRHSLSTADIEEDMVPAAAKERMKSYGKKIVKKLMQSGGSVPAPVPFAAVEALSLDTYEVSVIPIETCGVGAVSEADSGRSLSHDALRVGAGLLELATPLPAETQRRHSGSTDVDPPSGVCDAIGESSEASLLFPKGRFMILPTCPLSAPPTSDRLHGTPPTCDRLNNTPRHVPSCQSLQGMYTTGAMIVDTEPSSPRQRLDDGVPSVSPPSGSRHGQNRELCLTSHSGTSDPGYQNHTNKGRTSYEIVSDLITRGTPQSNEGTPSIPPDPEMRTTPPSSPSHLSHPSHSSHPSHPSHPSHSSQPCLGPDGSPGNIGRCIGRAMNTLLHDSSCSSGEEAGPTLTRPTATPTRPTATPTSPHSPNSTPSNRSDSAASTVTTSSSIAAVVHTGTGSVSSRPPVSFSFARPRVVYVSPLPPLPPTTSLLPSSPHTLPSVTHSTNTLPSVTHSTITLPSVTHSTNTLPSVTHSTITLPSVTHSTNTFPSVTHSTITLPSVTHSTNTLPSVTHSTNTLPSVTHTLTTLNSSVLTTVSRLSLSLSTRPWPTVSNAESPLPDVCSHVGQQKGVATSVDSISLSRISSERLFVPESQVLGEETAVSVLSIENPHFDPHRGDSASMTSHIASPEAITPLVGTTPENRVGFVAGVDGSGRSNSGLVESTSQRITRSGKRRERGRRGGRKRQRGRSPTGQAPLDNAGTARTPHKRGRGRGRVRGREVSETSPNSKNTSPIAVGEGDDDATTAVAGEEDGDATTAGNESRLKYWMRSRAGTDSGSCDQKRTFSGHNSPRSRADIETSDESECERSAGASSVEKRRGRGRGRGRGRRRRRGRGRV